MRSCFICAVLTVRTWLPSKPKSPNIEPGSSLSENKSKNEVLQQVNREFFNFFGGDPFLNKKLMAPVRNMSLFISYGLNKRLNELGIFYVWQIMLRTEKYFQDHIGGKETFKLKNHLAENGLYLGMRPNGTKQPRR